MATPLRRFDGLFGGQLGDAERALSRMRRTYGRKEGDQVFWGTVAKRKRKGPAKRATARAPAARRKGKQSGWWAGW